MAASNFLVVALCMVIGGCAGQSMMDFGGGCVIDCMQKFSEKAQPLMGSTASSSASPSSLMMGSQDIQVGNTTVSCPAPMNRTDMAKLDLICESAKDLMKCSDACPDDLIKNMTSAAFKPIKYMCVDKIDEVKKYGPCLSQACPAVQQTCVPKCGSMEEMAMKMKSSMSTGFGGGDEDLFATTTAAPQLAAALTTAASKFLAGSKSGSNQSSGIDSSFMDDSSSSFVQILKMVGDMCSSLDCYMNCSKAPTIEKCGAEAFALNQDLMEMVFTTVNDMMSSFGMQDMLPTQCKALMGTTPATGGQQTTSTGASNLVPTVEPVVLPNITSAQETPANISTINVSNTAASSNVTSQNNQTNQEVAASTKGSSTITMSSLLLAIMSFMVFVKANRV